MTGPSGYVALPRGINVGGRNKIPMAERRERASIVSGAASDATTTWMLLPVGVVTDTLRR